MCKIYNSLGSLKTVKNYLDGYEIRDFNSLREVIDFQNSYPSLREHLIENYRERISEEKKQLEKEIERLSAEIEQLTKAMLDELGDADKQLNILAARTFGSQNIFKTLFYRIKKWTEKRAIKRMKVRRQREWQLEIATAESQKEEKANRYNFIQRDFDRAVQESAVYPLHQLDIKKQRVDSLNPFIYGALGEQMVVKELEGFSDEYSLINDFSVTLSEPLFYRQQNTRIRSVQIDHILIGPSGVFLIETKNWSEESLENLDLHSPVEQVQRASFLIFRLLDNDRAAYYLGLETHHWGGRKIPIRNLIVLINKKPKGEFQFVKTLTLRELRSYVQYFQPIFSQAEVESITDYLLSVNTRGVVAI